MEQIASAEGALAKARGDLAAIGVAMGVNGGGKGSA